MTYELSVFLVSIVAGAIASVAGFGIGSLVTPILSLSLGTKLAIAIVSVPHLIGTSIRFFMLRQYVDKKVLLGFGILSTVGGLLGALLYASFATPSLTLIFGALLLFAGFMGVTGISEKMQFHGLSAWIAGGVSGVLGGMIGNQGGIRSAALLGFNISKESFVATATAIGLIVDGARMPVYFWNHHEAMITNSKWILIASVGVTIGTVLGAKLLKKLNQRTFRRVVSAFIFILGLFMLYQATLK